MGKSTSVKREIRFQQWIQQVKEYNERPDSIAETAKANNLKPYDYFEYLLEEIPKHMEDTDRSFLEDLLPWSENLPAHIRK
jgi:transposase